MCGEGYVQPCVWDTYLDQSVLVPRDNFHCKNSKVRSSIRLKREEEDSQLSLKKILKILAAIYLHRKCHQKLKKSSVTLTSTQIHAEKTFEKLPWRPWLALLWPFGSLAERPIRLISSALSMSLVLRT